jgi:hypothetical protein
MESLLSQISNPRCYHCDATKCVVTISSACRQCGRRHYARCQECCHRWDVNIVLHFLCRSCERANARKLPALLDSFFNPNSWGVTLPTDLVRVLFMPLMYWNHPLPRQHIIQLPLQYAPVCFHCARYYPAANDWMCGHGRTCCVCRMGYVRCPGCVVPSPSICVFCKTPP